MQSVVGTDRVDSPPNANVTMKLPGLETSGGGASVVTGQYSPVPEACGSTISPGSSSEAMNTDNNSNSNSNNTGMVHGSNVGGGANLARSASAPAIDHNSPWEPVPYTVGAHYKVQVPRVVSTLMPAANDGPGVEDRNGSDTTIRRVGSNVSTASSPRVGGSSSSLSLKDKDAGNSKVSPTRRKTIAKAKVGEIATSTATTDNTVSGDGPPAKTTTQRRQKRLERNRESARLSRRRRKQYLEVLEDRVTEHSHDLDKGRREHVAVAVVTILNKRRQYLLAHPGSFDVRSGVLALQNSISRCSQELRIAYTFLSQQQVSFSLPPSSKFLLWLTLQSDTFFRGGRAASERLSAARIGERMLNSGTDRVTPTQSMWPLICCEVGLSYEQEEKLRSFQRVILQTHETWLDRHTAYASKKAMDSTHDAVQALALRFGQRERSSLASLSDDQKLRFLSWAEKNRERVKSSTQHFPRATFDDEKYKISKDQHIAANLYVLNHRLEGIVKKVPRAAPLVTGIALKKLSRRPSFESLGCTDKNEGGMSRENSFASSGSLKRAASEMSMVEENGEGEDKDKPQVPQVSPIDAQNAAASVVESVLGHLKGIMPPPPTPMAVSSLPIPSPTPLGSLVASQPKQQYQHPRHVVSHPQLQPQYAYQQPPAPLPQYHHHHHHHHHHSLQPIQPMPTHAVQSQPPPAPYQQPPPPPPQQPQEPLVSAPAPSSSAQSSASSKSHTRSSSFLPPHLNVVPEEMWPNDGTTEDLLMSLVDEDWAIGEGVDMELDQE